MDKSVTSALFDLHIFFPQEIKINKPCVTCCQLKSSNLGKILDQKYKLTYVNQKHSTDALI